MPEPLGLVEIDFCGGHDDGTASMSFEVGARHQSVSRWWRRGIWSCQPMNVARAWSSCCGLSEVGSPERMTRQWGSPLSVSVPTEGGVVDLGDRVQVIEQPGGRFDQNEQQTAGERVKRAAVANPRRPSAFSAQSGLEESLDEREARGTDGFVDQVNAEGSLLNKVQNNPWPNQSPYRWL